MNPPCTNVVVNATDHGPAAYYCSTRCRMAHYRLRKAQQADDQAVPGGAADPTSADPNGPPMPTPATNDPDEMLRQAAALLGAAWRTIGVTRADDRWVAEVTRANQAIDAALKHRDRYRNGR